MPIYEYEAVQPEGACAKCGAGFGVLQGIREAPLAVCPQCGAAVRRRISAPNVGISRTGLDHRAKAAGFKKLRRLGKGEYEKVY